MEQICGCCFFLYEAPSVKYTGIIHPLSDNRLLMDVLLHKADDGNLALTAAVSSDGRKVMSCRIKLKKTTDGKPEIQ